MSWLVVLRPVRAEMPFEPTDEESRAVQEHFAYLLRLRDEGKLVLAGPSPVAPGDTIGIAVYDVGVEAEVRAIVDADPAVTSGVMTAELRPFRISVR
jgi:uncharacterized protein YciI